MNVNLATADLFRSEIARLQNEIARLRLTEPERLCILAARDAYALDDGDEECDYIAAALTQLLDRTK